VLEKRVFIITGTPGSGKTTVLSKIVETLKTRDIKVGGMISREARDCCSRLGFEVIDLTSGKHGWLAHVDQKTGPRIGKYRVNLADLERIGVEAIVDATRKCDVVAIDEIGPMELFSPRFKEAVREALDSEKVVLAVVHAKAHDLVILEVKKREDAEVFLVTLTNRDGLPKLIMAKVLSILTNTSHVM
jgi:nucleoside-triphosphatase